MTSPPPMIAVTVATMNRTPTTLADRPVAHPLGPGACPCGSASMSSCQFPPIRCVLRSGSGGGVQAIDRDEGHAQIADPADQPVQRGLVGDRPRSAGCRRCRPR